MSGQPERSPARMRGDRDGDGRGDDRTGARPLDPRRHEVGTPRALNGYGQHHEQPVPCDRRGPRAGGVRLGRPRRATGDARALDREHRRDRLAVLPHADIDDGAGERGHAATHAGLAQRTTDRSRGRHRPATSAATATAPSHHHAATGTSSSSSNGRAANTHHGWRAAGGAGTNHAPGDHRGHATHDTSKPRPKRGKD